jgi:hypothetical protein
MNSATTSTTRRERDAFKSRGDYKRGAAGGKRLRNFMSNTKGITTNGKAAPYDFYWDRISWDFHWAVNRNQIFEN